MIPSIRPSRRLQTTSPYQPGRSYDKRLLDSAPEIVGNRGRYDVNLLAGDNSVSTRAAAAADVGHHNHEAGLPATKEGYDPSHSVPWYRQKKWRAIVLVAAVVFIGAVVGGAVGGTLASKNSNSDSGPHEPSTVTVQPSTGASSGALAESTTTTPRDPPTGTGVSPSQPPGTSTSSVAVVGTLLVKIPPPTTSPPSGNFDPGPTVSTQRSSR